MSGDIDLGGSLEGVRYERADHVATITLDRPDRGNSLTPRMQPILREIWKEVRDDPWIRVAIVRASGERGREPRWNADPNARVEDVEDEE